MLPEFAGTDCLAVSWIQLLHQRVQRPFDYGLSTSAWEHRLENRSDAVRQGLPLQAGLVLFGGGEPFLDEEDIVGAIGVSGGGQNKKMSYVRWPQWNESAGCQLALNFEQAQTKPMPALLIVWRGVAMSPISYVFAK
jgi:hypothetical protein